MALSPGHTHAHTPRNSTSARKATVSVTPANFGGDPTGVKDSTEAIRTAIQHCLNQSTLSPNGLFPGSTSFPNQEGIRDMGGCEVNLDGGTDSFSLHHC